MTERATAQETVDNWVPRQDVMCAVSARELDPNGAVIDEASHNGAELFVAASTIKSIVAARALKAVGVEGLDRPYPYGDQETVGDALRDFIVISANKPLYPLVQYYAGGMAEFDASLKNEGYQDTRINNYPESGSAINNKRTSAEDLLKFYERLYNGELLDEQEKEYLLELLSIQEFPEPEQRAIPSVVDDVALTVANKPGWLDKEDVDPEEGIRQSAVNHDAGIIYGPQGRRGNVIILAVLTDGAPSENIGQLAHELCAG